MGCSLLEHIDEGQRSQNHPTTSKYHQWKLSLTLSPLISILLFITILLFQLIYVNSLIIDEIQRTVDLTNRIVKVKIQTTLSNPSKTVPYFYVGLQKDVHSHMGQIWVYYKNQYINVEYVRDIKSAAKDLKDLPESDNFVLYKVPLEVPQQSKVSYQLEFLVGKVHRPLPKTITFKSQHYTVYEDRSYSFSPYLVKKQQTVFNIPNDSLLNASSNLQQKETNQLILTSKINDQPAFTLRNNDVKIHYRLNSHLGYFPNVERQIEVSHWGAVSIKEQFTFENLAAGLNEEYDQWTIAEFTHTIFSRIRKENKPYPDHRTCFELESILPKSAYDVEFFDEIGNISSSHARRDKNYALLQFEPRYPILGGWKADWRIEYKIPTEAVVSPIKLHQSYRLTIPLGPGIKQVFTDLLKVKVVLPAGAHNIKTIVPRSLLHEINVGNYWGWLDLLNSRPFIELTIDRFALLETDLLKHNLQIDYNYRPAISDIRKPLGCAVTVFIPFLLFIILSRIDIRIYSKKVENSLTDVYVIDQVRLLITHIIDISSTFWTALQIAKSNDDIVSLKVNCKAQQSPILLRLSQMGSLSHDTLSLSTQQFVSIASNDVTRYVKSLDRLADDARVGGWKLPVTSEKEVELAKWRLHQLLVTIASMSGESGTSTPTIKKTKAI